MQIFNNKMFDLIKTLTYVLMDNYCPCLGSNLFKIIWTWANFVGTSERTGGNEFAVFGSLNPKNKINSITFKTDETV